MTHVRLCLYLLTVLYSCCAYAEPYPLVINHGRVLDPESGLDAVRHLGIRDGAIVALSETPLLGTAVINAADLVVAPGFIDLHTHSPTDLGQYYQLFDGVTTALELEAGSFPVLEYGRQISDQPLINYGASAGYLSIRLLEKNGIAAPDPTGKPRPVGLNGWMTAARLMFTDFNTALQKTFRQQATEAELKQLRIMLNQGLDDGALGIGLALDYISEAVDQRELHMVFEVAAERGAPVFVHIRRGINGDPAGLYEVLALAEETGAALHICHISHNAMKNIELFLAEVRAARQRGLDVTTEVLPYNAGSTQISAAVFSRDWQTIFGISYEDVEWAATGERFTAATWEKYREEHPTGAVIHHYLKEDWTLRAVREPGVIIVSDLLPMKSKDEHVPPHNGAFSKVLGKYVRQEQALDLMTAVAKMTLLPARRLQEYAPAFGNKGRIAVGMDADITIFDPDTIAARATYRDPYQKSSGIAYVFVNGQLLVSQGELVSGVFPGQRIVRD